MKAILFSHESDVDGIFSVSIALTKYPTGEPFFTNYGLENAIVMKDFLRRKLDEKDEPIDLILLSDLGISNERSSVVNVYKEMFEIAKSRDCRIIWVDHHPWSDQAVLVLKKYVNFVIDPSGEKCASELMYEIFANDNKIAAALASVAHTSDFFEKNRLIPPIGELICYYRNLPSFQINLTNLARKASKGILWDTEMQLDYDGYSNIRDKEKSRILSTIIEKKVKQKRVIFMESSSYLQTSVLADEVFQTRGADLIMLYGSNGKVSVRRNDRAIDFAQIAKYLRDGGGHPFASGGWFWGHPKNTYQVLEGLESVLCKVL